MEKLSKLVSRLLERTEKGLVAWEPTADEDTFQFSLADSSVLIEFNGQKTYFISIINGDGQIVDVASDKQLDDFDIPFDSHHDLMKKLYEVARRKALKADETLDGILAELGD